MIYKTGEFVMYGASGVCKVVGIETKCFDGVNENQYYVISPLNSEFSTYYIPEDTIESKTRKLLDKEKVLGLVESISVIEPIWSNDKNERKSMFQSTLKSDDYVKLIGMIKSIYIEKMRKSSLGGKLAISDETAMRTAENLMYQEFGVVLEMSSEEVNTFIRDRIKDSCVTHIE